MIGQLKTHMIKIICIFTARKRSLGQGNIFTSIYHSVGGEGGVGFPEKHHRSHYWVGLHPGGLHLGGVCIWGSLHLAGLGRPPWIQTPREHYWIRLIRGRYASYWNAFLFTSSESSFFNSHLTPCPTQLIKEVKATLFVKRNQS